MFSSPGWTTPSVSLSSQEKCSIPLITFDSLLCILPVEPGCFLLHWNGVEGQKQLSQPLGHSCCSAGYSWLSGLQAQFQIMSTFTSIHSPKSFSVGLSSTPSFPRLYWYQGWPPPKCRTFYLALLYLLKFTWIYFSSLFRSIWMVSHSLGVSAAPLSLLSSANLLQSVHLITLCF